MELNRVARIIFMVYLSQFNGDISNWDVSKVYNMGNMFLNAFNFNQDISDWDVSNVTSMTRMLESATSFDQDISSWDVSNVTNSGFNNSMIFANTGLSDENKCAIHSSFSSNETWTYDWEGYCIFMPQSTEELQVAINLWIEDNSSPSLEYYGDINTWNVSLITDMSNLFANQPYFNDDLSLWDVSNVENMENMFNNTIFNKPLCNWKLSRAKNISGMFLNASEFNCDINDWDVSNVEDMNCMFERAYKFNQNLSKWNPSKCEKIYYMFLRATAFDLENNINATMKGIMINR